MTKTHCNLCDQICEPYAALHLTVHDIPSSNPHGAEVDLCRDCLTQQPQAVTQLLQAVTQLLMSKAYVLPAVRSHGGARPFSDREFKTVPSSDVLTGHE